MSSLALISVAFDQVMHNRFCSKFPILPRSILYESRKYDIQTLSNSRGWSRSDRHRPSAEHAWRAVKDFPLAECVASASDHGESQPDRVTCKLGGGKTASDYVSRHDRVHG